MGFLSSEDEFRRISTILRSTVDLNNDGARPRAAQAEALSLGLDFDDVRSSRFFIRLQAALRDLKEVEWFFYVLDPDPVAYYARHFGIFPITRFTCDDNASKYIRELHNDPGGSPADCVMDRADKVVLFSQSGIWYVYADRWAESAEIVCTTDAARNAFKKAFENTANGSECLKGA